MPVKVGVLRTNRTINNLPVRGEQAITLGPWPQSDVNVYIIYCNKQNLESESRRQMVWGHEREIWGSLISSRQREPNSFEALISKLVV